LILMNFDAIFTVQSLSLRRNSDALVDRIVRLVCLCFVWRIQEDLFL
jgi:hypothetical protein